MTTLVRLLVAQPPRHAGEEVALPDDVAAGAVAQGVAEIVPSVFDKARHKPALLPPLYSTRVMHPRKRAK